MEITHMASIPRQQLILLERTVAKLIEADHEPRRAMVLEKVNEAKELAYRADNFREYA